MKKAVYVFIAILIVLLSYEAFYSYIQEGGIKIIHDNTGIITKQSDAYLHYKILNKKLLYDYGIDFRVLIKSNIKDKNSFAKKELQAMQNHPRKINPNRYADKFIFVLINPIDKSLIIKSNIKKYPLHIFFQADKTDIKKYVISLEEIALDYEWKKRLNKQ